jgi:hypothetical protein
LLAQTPTLRMYGLVSDHRPDLAGLVSHWNVPGEGRPFLLHGHRMKAF